MVRRPKGQPLRTRYQRDRWRAGGGPATRELPTSRRQRLDAAARVPPTGHATLHPDLADYLVRKGSLRTAHHVVGSVVASRKNPNQAPEASFPRRNCNPWTKTLAATRVRFRSKRAMSRRNIVGRARHEELAKHRPLAGAAVVKAGPKIGTTGGLVLSSARNTPSTSHGMDARVLRHAQSHRHLRTHRARSPRALSRSRRTECRGGDRTSSSCTHAARGARHRHDTGDSHRRRPRGLSIEARDGPRTDRRGVTNAAVIRIGSFATNACGARLAR